MRRINPDRLPTDRTDGRDNLDPIVLLQRAGYLEQDDQLLMAAMFERGLSSTVAGGMMGFAAAPSAAPRDGSAPPVGESAFRAGHSALPYLGPRRRDIVLRHVVRGQSVRDVARQLACTLHQVRMELKLAEGIMAGLAADPPAPIRAGA